MRFYQHKYFVVFLAAAAIITTSSCGKKEEDKAKSKGPMKLRAEGYVVQTQVYKSTYVASGSLLPNEQVDIHPEVAGRVISISFKEGSFVKKGQLLVQLNDADIRAQIEKLQAQRNLQTKTLARQKQLLDIGGISKQDYETTQTQISSIDADIAYSEAQLRKTKILAPFDGVVGIGSISVGAIVSPETIVASLQQPNPLKMDFTIPDQYKDMLKPGQELYFTVDGRQDTMMGKLAAVDPGADMSTRTIKARGIVPNTDRKLTAGSFAHVLINFSTDNSAILIPSQAIIPTTKDRKVAVVNNGKINIIVVKTGDRTEDRVQILQGLKAGDTVLTTGIMQVKQNAEVQVTKVVK